MNRPLSFIEISAITIFVCAILGGLGLWLDGPDDLDIERAVQLDKHDAIKAARVAAVGKEAR